MNGCLVVHGLTGTPACVAPLKDALIAANFSVASPCLAGHGSSVENLSKSTWHEWYETVRISYNELKKSCDKVFYAGISLGALLGLKLATDEGWGVRALALMSTPIVTSIPIITATYLVKYSPLRYIMKSAGKNFRKSVFDEEGREVYKNSSLPRIPASSVYQLFELQNELRPNLGKITNPVILLHGKKDTVAPTRNLSIIKKNISSDIVETVYLNKSRHVITLDLEKELVSQNIVNFFKKFS